MLQQKERWKIKKFLLEKLYEKTTALLNQKE